MKYDWCILGRNWSEVTVHNLRSHCTLCRFAHAAFAGDQRSTDAQHRSGSQRFREVRLLYYSLISSNIKLIIIKCLHLNFGLFTERIWNGLVLLSGRRIQRHTSFLNNKDIKICPLWFFFKTWCWSCCFSLLYSFDIGDVAY